MNIENDNSDENTKSNLLKTILTINRAYQEVINEKIQQLDKKLKYNLYCQSILIQKVSNCKSLIPNYKFNPTNKSVLCDNETELSKIKDNYFKDRYGSEPSENIDTLQRKKLNFYDYTPMLKLEWTVEYRNKLKKAVFNDCLKLIKTPFLNKITLLKEKINKVIIEDSDEDNENFILMQKLIKETTNKLKKIDALSETQVLNQVDPEKIDWMKISKIDLGGNWSSNECRLVWINVCNPKINQTKWTNQENNNLIDLARRYSEKNWKQISAETDTNRSAFLCMKRYHEKTAEKYCKRDWTQEETNELSRLVNTHRVGLFIPFNYLCYLIGTRDRNSVYNWHLKTDSGLNHGKWSQIEEQNFDEAIQYFNFNLNCLNWQEISEYIGTRTALQCKERYELKYQNPEKYINWSIEEDKKLLELVHQYGPQWVKIATNEFPKRTDHSCLFRYTKLMNWKRQTTWFDNQTDEVKEFIQFIFKKRRKINHDYVYTSYGDLVPTLPKFGSGVHNLNNIIDKIYEKNDLITEFIEKKRQGQLSLTLINKIGIYTPVLKNLITKFKKKYPITQIKQKKLKINNSKSKLKPKEAKVKVVKRKGKLTRKSSDKVSKLKQRTKTVKELYSESNLDLCETSTIALNFRTHEDLDVMVKKTAKSLENKTRNFTIKEIFQNLNQNSTKTVSASNEQEGANKVSLIEKSQTENSRKINEPVKKITKTKKPPKEKDDSREKRTIIILGNKKNQEAQIEKETSNNENLENISKATKSSLIIDQASIEIGTKIPCFKEQYNEYKYLYSLKKDASSQYLAKFTVVNCKGKLVGIQFLNGSKTDEYFNENKMTAIELALKKTFNK